MKFSVLASEHTPPNTEQSTHLIHAVQPVSCELLLRFNNPQFLTGKTRIDEKRLPSDGSDGSDPCQTFCRSFGSFEEAWLLWRGGYVPFSFSWRIKTKTLHQSSVLESFGCLPHLTNGLSKHGFSQLTVRTPFWKVSPELQNKKSFHDASDPDIWHECYQVLGTNRVT